MRIVFLVLLLVALACARTPASVTFDGGRPVSVDSIIPGGKTYLEVGPLASAQRWTLVDRPGASSILVNGQEITDIQRYEGRTYVSADALGRALGMTCRQRNSGQVVDFWKSGSTTTQAATGGVRLVLVKKEKLTSPTPDYQQLRLTLDVTNSGSQVLMLRSGSFSVVDDKQQKIRCSGNFEITLQPGEKTRVDRLYFDVPKRGTVTTLTLDGPNGQPLATSRI